MFPTAVLVTKKDLEAQLDNEGKKIPKWSMYNSNNLFVLRLFMMILML